MHIAVQCTSVVIKLGRGIRREIAYVALFQNLITKEQKKDGGL